MQSCFSSPLTPPTEHVKNINCMQWLEELKYKNYREIKQNQMRSISIYVEKS